MSTSSQSSASAAAYDVSNAAAAAAADGVLIHKHQQQQQQQHPTSSLSQRFHPYLMPYGRDSGALLSAQQSSSSSADYSLNRGQPQHAPDHHGGGLTDAASSSAAVDDSPFSGRQTHHHHPHPHQHHGQTTMEPSCPTNSSSSSSASRRLREFIPDHKKDDEYWMKRQKNNEAAKRSREKRRVNDMAMTKKILQLTADNKRLRLELEAIKRKYGLLPDVPFPVGDDDIAVDRSVSPVYVGISSSDDSSPPTSSSFPLYHHQPVSRSTPSPPVLDQFYQESSMVVVDRRDDHPDQSLLPTVPAASRHYQSPEGSYHHHHGQHVVLQQSMSMQQKQPVPPSLKSVPFVAAEDSVPVVRALQSYSTTSTCTPARIGYLQLETHDDGDLAFNRGDGGKQPFDKSMIRSSSLTDELLLSSSPTISLAPPHPPPVASGSSLVQEYFQPPKRVTTSTSEVPLLTFSDLSSDDDDDDVVAACLRAGKRRLLSSEAPLNLTKRSLSWQAPSTRFPLPNSSYGASAGRPAASSLRNDSSRSFPAAFQLQALPYHELWTEESSKDSTENYSAQTLQQQQRGEYLRDSRDSGEMLSQYHQPRLSMFTARETCANVAIKVEGADSSPNVAASSMNPMAYSDACYEDRDDARFSSDLAADSIIDSVAQNSSRQVRGGVPLKVWHKRSLLSAAAGNSHMETQVFQNTSAAATATSGASLTYDDHGGGLLMDTSPNNSPTSSGDSVVNFASEFSDSDSTQAQYQQQQHQDRAPGPPPAGRRSRKSRKQLATGLNLTAATILESENNKLKEELRSLSRDVTDLKEIIGKKRKDSCNGNPGLGSVGLYEKIETDT